MSDTNATPEFLFRIPPPRDVSDICNTLLQLGAMAGRLANEARTQVDHADGRPENVAEHSHMLSRTAPILAMLYYPDLDAGLVALFCNVHDDHEAYTGDTPTMRPTEGLMAAKKVRDLRGVSQLIVEYSHIEPYVALVREYEEQKLPEARLVKVLDKLLPMVVQFNQGGATLRTHWTPETLLDNNRQRVEELLAEYPEFAQLINVRQELAELAITELF